MRKKNIDNQSKNLLTYHLISSIDHFKTRRLCEYISTKLSNYFFSYISLVNSKTCN